MLYIYKGWLTAVGEKWCEERCKKKQKQTLFADILQMWPLHHWSELWIYMSPGEHHSTPTTAPICFQPVNLQEGCVEEI